MKQRAPLVVVTGTGTGIGKTWFAVALSNAWSARGACVAARKPIESGRNPVSDVRLLERASTFHEPLPPSPYLFVDPVSPHLAARREGRRIDLAVIRQWVDLHRAAADGLIVELPGGLFSPLDDTTTNADLVLTLDATKVVLVAPDRLGVLHDVLATTRAASASSLVISGVVLNGPALSDPSTGTNAAELARVLPAPPLLGTLRRDHEEDVEPILARLLGP